MRRLSIPKAPVTGVPSLFEQFADPQADPTGTSSDTPAASSTTTHTTAQQVSPADKTLPFLNHLPITAPAPLEQAQSPVAGAMGHRRKAVTGKADRLQLSRKVQVEVLGLKRRMGTLPASAAIVVLSETVRRLRNLPLPMWDGLPCPDGQAHPIARALAVVRDALPNECTPSGTYVRIDAAACAAAVEELRAMEAKYSGMNQILSQRSPFPALADTDRTDGADDRLLEEARAVCVVAECLRSLLVMYGPAPARSDKKAE